ncbi:hypothetical protein D3C73_1430720 [compost metagenome]
MPRENELSSGTSAIWIGTICRANTKMNSALRPLKSIHAKAYAAIDAIINGTSVAGMVIAMELMNDSRMVSWVVPDCSTST